MKGVQGIFARNNGSGLQLSFRCNACGCEIPVYQDEEADVVHNLCVRCHWCPHTAAIFHYFIDRDGTPSLEFIRNA